VPVAWSVIAVLSLVVTVWVISVVIRDASIVDIAWGFGFVVIAWVVRLTEGGSSNLRRNASLAAVTIWGLRLALHLGVRNLGKGEDYRYQLMRRKHGDRFALVSLPKVFLLQGALMLVVSAPAIAGGLDAPVDRAALAWVGIAVCAIGIAIETIADRQLAAFRRNPANKQQTLNTGLWAWSRHPNYFGDALTWWGIWLISCAHPWGPATIVGPIVMTFLLRRVSGVPMLEHSMAKRRPGYAEYVARTPVFVPRPPRR
jgi:steroid 5-alpha reductase family enzyme